MPLPHSPPASPLGSSWQFRLNRLQSALAGDPKHEQAWRWRIQIKVLTFLLSRYGNDAAYSATPCEDSIPVRGSHKRTDALTEVSIPSAQPGLTLRSGKDIRKVLEHAARLNPPQPYKPLPSTDAPPLFQLPAVFHYTFADVVKASRGQRGRRWLPLAFLLLHNFAYLVLVLCVAAPWLYFLLMLLGVVR